MITAKGNPARIIDLAKNQEIELILSASILEEIRRVLFYPRVRKIHKRGQEIIDDLDEVATIATFTRDVLILDVIKSDPSDNKYLVCALEGGANYIISGDHHLLELKIFHGVEILKPEEFLLRVNRS